MLHNFYSLSHSPIMAPFSSLIIQRSRMLCESTFGRVDPGRLAKLYTWQKVFPGRRVTLPSQASDPASRLALLVDRLEPTVNLSHVLYFRKIKRWRLSFSSTHFFLIRTSKFWPSLIVLYFLGNFSLNCSFKLFLFEK